MPGYLFTKAFRVVMQKCRLFSSTESEICSHNNVSFWSTQHYLSTLSKLAGCLDTTSYLAPSPDPTPFSLLFTWRKSTSLLVFSFIKLSAEWKDTPRQSFGDTGILYKDWAIPSIHFFFVEADHHSFYSSVHMALDCLYERSSYELIKCKRDNH